MAIPAERAMPSRFPMGAGNQTVFRLKFSRQIADEMCKEH
jgi:hypothetical protein